jgi:hypothetical protein
MKFNWGTGIFIVIALFFVAVIAFYIYINQLDINLVENNYYEKELAYQERIDKIDNTSSLAGKISLAQEPGAMIIRFPGIEKELKPEGTVLFYRPSDPKKDFTIPLQLNDSLEQTVNVSAIDPGKWTIKIDWKMGGKDYYFEEGIIISH